MDYLVISDIHGSLSGARALADGWHTGAFDAILCLGDVLYHGPRNDLPGDYAPKEVISLLNPLAEHIIAVRGNCDAEVDQVVLNFPLTADYSEFLLGRRRVFMTHGHVYGPDRLPLLTKGDILLSGHTHIPTCDERNGLFFLNPGSISLPKEGHPKTYGTLHESGFSVITAEGRPYMEIHF